MKLRLKTAVPVLAGLALVAAAGWILLGRICDESVSALSREATRVASSELHAAMRRSVEEMGALLGTLARNRELTAAVASRDHRRLRAVGAPIFRELWASRGITHLSYWDVEEPGAAGGPLRNLVRLGTPSVRGDLVERETLSRVSREKALVSGLELGDTGFILRALAPLQEGGRLVGYAELGREIGTFLRELKGRSGYDLAVVLDRRLIHPQRWGAARHALGERNDWADREDIVVARHTMRGTAAIDDLSLPAAIPDEGRALELRREGSRILARGAFPLRDASGRTVGAVFVIREVTTIVNDLDGARRTAEGAFAAAVVLVTVAVLAALELLVVRAGGRAPAP